MVNRQKSQKWGKVGWLVGLSLGGKPVYYLQSVVNLNNGQVHSMVKAELEPRPPTKVSGYLWLFMHSRKDS